MQPVKSLARETGVSLLLVSGTHSLQALRAAFGETGDAGSHDRGDARPGGGVFAESVLRIDSGAEPGAEPSDHLRALAGRFPAARLAHAALPPGSYRVVVSVAVIFQTASCTVVLDVDALERLREYGAALEVAAYPVD